MKKKNKTIFYCQSCGYESLKWLGKCPECESWDSFVEEISRKQKVSYDGFSKTSAKPVPINDIQLDQEERIMCGISEFDRVLGGGLVIGSLVLIGGDPGIGKSTLMLQALAGLSSAGKKVLYVSGEESAGQLKMRARRLDVDASGMLVLAEVDLAAILLTAENEKPDVLVIDSIQTMYNSEVSSAPGSVSQVRESTMKLMVMAKKTGIPTFLIGHVTKDGAIAGPRIMEHMVDTVLYFEGDRNHVFRILRAVKNRFGSTNEIGVFEMKEDGLSEITNPSSIFLAERPDNSPGSVVSASMEGTRPILLEIQGLTSSTNFATPRRTILGLDTNRVALLIAVMENKLGLNLAGLDVFMNVAGGVKVVETAVDVAIAAAIASSFLNKPVEQGVMLIGEIGLTGEVRAVSHIENRILEAEKMGFTSCILPENSRSRIKETKGIKLIGISAISDVMELLF